MKKILVCDDELLILEVLEHILRYYDCKSYFASNKNDVLKLVANHSYDLIFLEPGLREDNGLEIAQKIRASDNNAFTPIIAITGSFLMQSSQVDDTSQESDTTNELLPDHSLEGNLPVNPLFNKRTFTIAELEKSGFNEVVHKPFHKKNITNILEWSDFTKKKSFQAPLVYRPLTNRNNKIPILFLESKSNLSNVLSSNDIYDVHVLNDSTLFIEAYSYKHYLFPLVIIDNSNLPNWEQVIKQINHISPLANVLLLTNELDINTAIASAKLYVSSISFVSIESYMLFDLVKKLILSPVISDKKNEFIKSWLSDNKLESSDLINRLLWTFFIYQHKNLLMPQNDLLSVFNKRKNNHLLSLEEIKNTLEHHLKCKLDKLPKANLLIIEDEKYYLELLKHQLKPLYNVFTAKNTAEARAHLNSDKQFHHMLLDIYLPQEKGDVLYNEVHLHYPDIKVIVITGYPEAENAFKLLQLGINAYLKKPFSAKEMYQTLGNIWLNSYWSAIDDKYIWQTLMFEERLYFLNHILANNPKPWVNDIYALFVEFLTERSQ